MQSIYESPSRGAVALADTREECYVAQFIGRVARRHYRAALLQILKQARQDSYAKLILNVKELENNPDPGRQWFTTHFVRRFYKYVGSLQLAVVQSKNKVERIGFSVFFNAIQSIGIHIQVKYFDTFKEAHQWVSDAPLRPLPTLLPASTKHKGLQKSNLPEQVKEIRLKQNRLKVKVQFSPRGDLDSSMSTNPISALNIKENLLRLKDRFGQLAEKVVRPKNDPDEEV
ncbi:MAG: hypothetical protein HC880_15115 [Bacteroidia bacterium]|nr:hypothetical protein [Bacteroidia bacterium]